MYLKAKKIEVQKLNENDAYIPLAKCSANSKSAMSQIEKYFIVPFKKVNKTILGKKEVFYYTENNVFIGSLCVTSGKLMFMTYSKFIETPEDRLIISTTYKRTISNFSKNFNEYYFK